MQVCRYVNGTMVITMPFIIAIHISLFSLRTDLHAVVVQDSNERSHAPKHTDTDTILTLILIQTRPVNILHDHRVAKTEQFEF